MSFASLAPTLRVDVEDNELSSDITKLVTRCEVELTRDIADQISLTIVNPVETKMGEGNTGRLLFTDSKMFQPGNEVSIFMGYGDPVFIGRGIIDRFLPSFPREGVPTLTIKAHDASTRMMDGEAALEPAIYVDMTYDQIVTDVIKKHGILPGIIDPVDVIDKRIAKKRGMSDYIFVKGLANLVSYEFRVYWDNDAHAWKANWRAPRSDQQRAYEFSYLNGPDSTLIEFEPSFGLRDAPNGVQVLYWDKDTRGWEEMKVEEDKTGDSPLFTGTSSDMEEEIKSSSKLRIAAAGRYVEVVADRPFASADEAYQFAERWMRARKDSFLMGNGKTIGLENLRPGDIHRLSGLGTQLSGDWEFSTVSHSFTSDRGYECGFFALKVIE